MGNKKSRQHERGDCFCDYVAKNGKLDNLLNLSKFL